MESENPQWPSSSFPPENLRESFIGSFVSLISNNDKRYDGVLYHLDLQASKLGLRNVTCCGREEKNNNAVKLIQLDLSEVYSSKLFSGSDIKDLKVLSLPAQPNIDYLIGHIVSVITKEDVRCEGVITHINFRDSMIFMKNVTCFGFEKRKKRSACKKLPGAINFTFKQIKDMELIFLLPKHLDLEVIAAGESSEFPQLTRPHFGH